MEDVQTRRNRLVSECMDQMMIDRMEGEAERADFNSRLALLFTSAPDEAFKIPRLFVLEGDYFRLGESGIPVHRVAIEGFLAQRYGLSDDDIGHVLLTAMNYTVT